MTNAGLDTILERLSKKLVPDEGRTYRCPKCRDNGWVYVPEDGKLERVVRCSCIEPAEKKPVEPERRFT